MVPRLSTAGLARSSSRHPWRTLAIWFVALVLAGVAASGLADALVTEDAILKGDSVRGQELLEERLRGPHPATETVLVRSAQYTVDDPQFRATVEQTTADLMALEGVEAAVNYYQAHAAGVEDAEQMVADDRHTTLIAVTFRGLGSDAHGHTAAYLAAIHASGSPGVEVRTIGALSTSQEFKEIAERDLRRGEGIGLLIGMVVLVVVFGALVAAGIPIVLALVSIFVALGLTALVGKVFELSFFVTNMITMIGLAVGIDYALFIVERYREERRNGATKHDAITVAGGTAGKSVLFSGITVVLALVGLLLLPMTVFRSLGAGAILVVIVAIVASLTLIPAMLALIGDKIDWPRRRKTTLNVGRPARRSISSRVALAHPLVAVILTLGVLLAATLPVLDLQKGNSGAETLPAGEIKTSYEILEREFSAGLLAPVEIVVDAERTPEVEAAIERLSATLHQDPSFVPAVDVEWNAAGDLALVTVPLSVNSNSTEASETIQRLRDDLVPSAFGRVDADVLVSGVPAVNTDVVGLIDTYTPVIFAFVLGLSFLLLLVAFRSVIVPLKAIAMNMLSVGATYGLLVLVFQKGVGAGLLGFQQSPVIQSWIPIFLFCVLFGLSMDYHIILLSRIREHFDASGDNRESVAVGLQSTGRMITGAALIMVVVFSGFATSDLVGFQQMGFGLAVAVLLDATIVRTILVPSSMALLGSRNWYLPRWLAWLPNLRVEGAPAHVEELATAGAGDD